MIGWGYPHDSGNLHMDILHRPQRHHRTPAQMVSEVETLQSRNGWALGPVKGLRGHPQCKTSIFSLCKKMNLRLHLSEDLNWFVERRLISLLSWAAKCGMVQKLSGVSIIVFVLKELLSVAENISIVSSYFLRMVCPRGWV